MWQLLAESFTIFAKYNEDGLVETMEGGIFAGPDFEKTSPQDKERLFTLGWIPDPYGGWYRELNAISRDR